MKSQLLALIFSLMISHSAQGEVVNGNFSISFNDLSVSRSPDLHMVRVYNSKSDFIGIFGPSWGTQFESNLRFDIDGSIFIRSYGSGANNHFLQKKHDPSQLNSKIPLMVNAAKKMGWIKSESDVHQYEAKIKSSSDQRLNHFETFLSKGLIPLQPTAEGQAFISTQFSYQYLTRVKNEYVLVREDGTVEKFNLSGRLTQIKLPNETVLNLEYNQQGLPTRINDQLKQSITLTYTPEGRVEKISSSEGKTANFKYDAAGLMTQSRDDHGVERTYTYTKDVYRNLTEIKTSSDPTKKVVIEYDPAEQGGNVKTMSDEQGIHNYKYEQRLDYHSIEERQKEAKGALHDSKFEFFTRTTSSGERRLMKSIATIDGMKTETLYDEKMGYPIQITRSDGTTLISYDPKGRKTKETSPTLIREYTYLKNGSVTVKERKK